VGQPGKEVYEKRDKIQEGDCFEESSREITAGLGRREHSSQEGANCKTRAKKLHGNIRGKKGHPDLLATDLTQVKGEQWAPLINCNGDHE